MTDGNPTPPEGVYSHMTTTPSPQLEEVRTPPSPTASPPGPVDFDTFYRRTYRDVAGALALTLGDRELGREAADEAMVRAWERWDRIATYDNPGGWTYRVGLNWARSLRRRLTRSLPSGWPGGTTRPDEGPEVADPAIAAALQDLPLPQRSVVVCRLLLDWSTEETATALHIRPGTVKSRLHRALSTLEHRLEDLR